MFTGDVEAEASRLVKLIEDLDPNWTEDNPEPANQWALRTTRQVLVDLLRLGASIKHEDVGGDAMGGTSIYLYPESFGVENREDSKYTWIAIMNTERISASIESLPCKRFPDVASLINAIKVAYKKD
jgi:hypothetical protein